MTMHSHYKECLLLLRKICFPKKCCKCFPDRCPPLSFDIFLQGMFYLSVSRCSYLETGCSVLRLILKSFAPVIKSNMAAPPVAVGCDIVREERFVV